MKRIRFYDSETIKWIDIDKEGIITNANTWKEELVGCKLYWPYNIRIGDSVYLHGKDRRCKEIPGKVKSMEKLEQEVPS